MITILDDVIYWHGLAAADITNNLSSSEGDSFRNYVCNIESPEGELKEIQQIVEQVRSMLTDRSSRASILKYLEGE